MNFFQRIINALLIELVIIMIIVIIIWIVRQNMKEFPQIVKNKKTVYTVKQVFLDFIEFDELWRREREKSQIYKGFSCFNYGKKY